jgi:hypothetical protein
LPTGLRDTALIRAAVMYLRRRLAILQRMNTYTVTAKTGESGFNVTIAGDDGIRQTTLGFASKSAADAWIVRAKRMARSWTPPNTFGRRKFL